VGRDQVAPALEARHISKSFGGTRALDGARIAVLRGEVHGLLGENGSGKSTLIRILAGYHAPDPGAELALGGREVPLPLRAGQAEALGLRFVHQDLGLIPSLSVVENLRLHELASGGARHVSWRRERERALETFARFGFALDPGAAVDDLSQLERAQLAIVRAVDDAPGVLVLDEPTAFLPRSEREQLFGLVRGIAGAGGSVLLVSHDLGEVRENADRVTVLRDGRNAGTVAARSVEPGELVRLVIGRRLEPLGEPRRGRSRDGRSIRVEGLSGEVVRDVSIELQGGESVGLTGLAGSGFEEVPYLLFGALPCSAGWLTLAGEHDLTSMTPERALGAGMALLPGDRARDGAVGSLPVAENVTLHVLDLYAAAAGLDRRRLLRDATELLERHRVTPADPRAPFETLSGGNQQKALLAKWLRTGPPLLLLDEPARGVDVAARREIGAALGELAGRGAAVLCASGDAELLAETCDRVLIFAGGAVAGQLAGDEVTKERIAERCSLSG
jgi:ribose transport system ATP-binding protein